MDITWISTQAKEIHTFFVSIFYSLTALLLVIGVLIDYFKIPIGGVPGFQQLIGRALVAGILLVAYPQISNWVSAVADSVADHLGSINTIGNVLDSAGKAFKDRSWSWTSIGDSMLSVVSILVYFVLYLTVFFFDAAIVYSLVLLYIFSPIMIAFYILPQTASMTGGLFRTLFEVAAWKIVFAVLGTLLWSTSLQNFQNEGQNFITLLALTLMLAFSILMTPLVVRNLISGSVANIASQTAGLAAVGLSAGFASPAALSGLAKSGTAGAFKWAGKKTWQGAKKTFNASTTASKNLKSHFNKNIQAQSSKTK